MKARPDILPHLLAARMRYWLDIARCPIMNTRVPTWRARRNYRALVRKYPEIAVALGYTEAMAYASPLHGLQQQEPQQAPPAPRQEFTSGSPNTDVSNQRLTEQIACSQPEPPASGVPRMFCLEDEVL